MMNFLVWLCVTIFAGYAAHEIIRIGNDKFPELDMSPNLCAIIGVIFGLYGIVVIVLFGFIKVMIRRMIKQ